MQITFTKLFTDPGVCVYQPGMTYELSDERGRNLIHYGIAKPAVVKPTLEKAAKNKCKRETR
jgi:hypothetical protein